MKKGDRAALREHEGDGLGQVAGHHARGEVVRRAALLANPRQPRLPPGEPRTQRL